VRFKAGDLVIEKSGTVQQPVAYYIVTNCYYNESIEDYVYELYTIWGIHQDPGFIDTIAERSLLRTWYFEKANQ
jgi:hypothetical protein